MYVWVYRGEGLKKACNQRLELTFCEGIFGEQYLANSEGEDLAKAKAKLGKTCMAGGVEFLIAYGKINFESRDYMCKPSQPKCVTQLLHGNVFTISS